MQPGVCWTEDSRSSLSRGGAGGELDLLREDASLDLSLFLALILSAR